MVKRMSVLRPKYTLDKASVEGARSTINAVPFTQLTSRRYPYPRVGTRAPNGMFPRGGNPGVPLPPRGFTAPRFIPGPLSPKFQYGNGNPGLGGRLKRRPYGYVESGPIVQAAAIKPHYTLNKGAVEGVMPASVYRRMTGKRTTEFTLPPLARERRVAAAPSAPALVDWGSVFGGVVLGGLVTLGMIYGVIPALAEVAAGKIRAW